MSLVGWFLSFLGFVGIVFGLFQMRKGKKMNAVPFRAPSQIAQLGTAAADAKGLVSTEGTVDTQGLLTAPMSGRPCLAFEITVERKWEKSERTENGTETKKGSSKVFSDFKGAVFSLRDGQSSVLVDATSRPDASFEKVHASGVNVGALGIIPAQLQFGQFQMSTPLILDTEGRTTGFEGVEKIVEPSPSLYALGALTMKPEGPVVHTPKGIGTGKLILSNKGRAALAKSTKRNMTLGYAIGGVLFVGGTALGIFGPAPDLSASGASCANTLETDVVACDGRMYEADGYDMKWTVTKAGEYTLTVSQPKVKFPIDPMLTIKDATGAVIAEEHGLAKGAEAKIVQKFEPGTYSLNVRDFFRDKVKSGYGFHLNVERMPDVLPAASAEVTSAVGSAAGSTAAAPIAAIAKGKGTVPALKPATSASGAPKAVASAPPKLAASAPPKAAASAKK